MTIYSHTYLENLAQCEHAGRAQLGPRVGKVGPAREGQAGHAVRDAYARHLVKEGLPSDVEVGRRIAGPILKLLTEEEEADLRRDLERWVDEWDGSYFLNAKDHTFEQRYWMTLDGEVIPPDRVQGVTAPVFAYTADHVWIDDDGLNVLDLKWGRVIEHTAAPAGNRQLRRYAAAEAMRRGWRKPITVHLEHGRHLYREEAVLDLDWPKVWQEEVVAPVKHWDKRLHGGEEASFSVGGHCADCDVRGRCPAYATYGYDEEGIGGEGLLEARAILTEKLSSVNERLKVLLEKGPVVGATHKAELATSETLNFDTAKLRPALLEILTDEQVDLAFTATKTSVSKALTRAKMKPAARKEALASLVEKAGSTTMSTRLSVTKVGKRGGAVDPGD